MWWKLTKCYINYKIQIYQYNVIQINNQGENKNGEITFAGDASEIEKNMGAFKYIRLSNSTSNLKKVKVYPVNYNFNEQLIFNINKN